MRMVLLTVLEILPLFECMVFYRRSKLHIKMEGFNPCGSVKDRPALNMISQAEVRGDLQPGGTVVGSTSGNLGTALAMICAQRGYRCIVVVDPRPANRT